MVIISMTSGTKMENMVMNDVHGSCLLLITNA